MSKGKKKAQSQKWAPGRLPKELAAEIDTVIEEHTELGYTGPPEFLRDAVREKLERIKTAEAQKVPAQ